MLNKSNKNKNNINGILNVLKPPGMTSFDVVSYLRRMLNTKKIGHAGTLDPAAAGVLPICVGNATKAIEYVMDMEKHYRAEMTLGIDTDTQDSSGKIINEISILDMPEDIITEAINSFIGEIEQVPPMYSALRIDGKRLYEIAREGKEIKRDPRKVFIHSIKVVSIRDNRVIFDVVCSKGTYIRTLCKDIGDTLGCGGHMSFLIRKKTGIFHIDNAHTLEYIKEMVNHEMIYDILIPTDKAFKDFDSFYLDNINERKYKNGNFIPITNLNAELTRFNIGTILKVYDSKKYFIGLGEVINKNGTYLLKPKKMIN